MGDHESLGVEVSVGDVVLVVDGGSVHLLVIVPGRDVVIVGGVHGQSPGSLGVIVGPGNMLGLGSGLGPGLGAGQGSGGHVGLVNG